MTPSRADTLLSKNNAKTLLFRNAHDAAELEKEERMLLHERRSEEKLFLKEREHMLQRQLFLAEELSPRARRKEMGYHSSTRQIKSSSLLPLPNIRISRSKSFSGSDNLSRTNNSEKLSVSPASSLASLSMSSMSFRQSTPPRCRRQMVADRSVSSLFVRNSSLAAVSLPDIHATCKGKIGGKKQNSHSKLQWSTGVSSCEDICVIEDWKGLKQCRYLRIVST